MIRAERFFELLLRLLPARFRDRFGDEMRATFRAEHAESTAKGQSAFGFWARAIAGVLTVAPREHLGDLGRDLRYTARTLRRQPAFTVTTALSLAIGIGATATVFAIFGATFGRTAPGVRAPEGLVNVHLKTAADDAFRRTSFPNYRDLRAAGALVGLAGFNGLRLSWAAGDAAEPSFAFAQVLSGDYFSVIGTRALRGRLLEPADEMASRPVAVISEHLWRDRLGSAPGVIGSTIRLNGEPFTVVGVAEEGFRGHFVGFRFDIFVPMSMAAVVGLPDLAEREGHWVELIGRLAAGDEPATARARAHAGLTVAAERLAAAFPDLNRGMEVKIEAYDGFDADLRGGLATFLVILFGVSTFVLLIACVNVANLMLGRLVRRQRELSIRRALGAPRGRLVRQLLSESLMIAGLAGSAGALLALWATEIARRALPDLGGGVGLDVRLDPSTLAATLALTLGVALVVGLVPAWRGSRAEQGIFLRGRDAAAGAGRWRGVLVVTQVVLSLVILVAAGLFVRALGHAASLDPGFDVERVLHVRLNPALAGMDERATATFFNAVLERLEAAPEVAASGLTSRVPLALGARFFSNTLEVAIPGHAPPPERDGIAIEHAAISPGYLQALGIPLQTGRGFDHRDGRAMAEIDPRERSGPADGDWRGVVLANETFSRRFFPDDGALAQVLRIDDRPVEVVGIVRDSRYRTLDEVPRPFLYLPLAATEPDSAHLMVTPAAGVGDISPRLREIVRELAPSLPVAGIERLEVVLAVSLTPQRIVAAVAGVMGLVGLFMTALGLYGVLAYSVSSRRTEIGVRLSLGAGPFEVVRLVLRQALGLALIGLLIGVPLAFAASRLMASFLYGLSPLDGLTYAAMCSLIALTAAVASFVPARRATRIDPMIVLRA